MPAISIFKNVGLVKHPKNLDLIDFLEKIRDGEWEDLVTACRVIPNKEDRDAFKRTMPTATLSGTFTERRDSDLIQHSSVLAIDLDHVENIQVVKRILERDHYVFAVFFSASGTGLRVLFRIEPPKHREAFAAISKYLFDKYEITSDPNGVNLSKPYIVSFDPHLFMRETLEDTKLFKSYLKETPIKPIQDFVHNDDDFSNVMRQITSKGCNICEDYNDWLKVGFAICEQFGENGRSYFHEVSKFSSKYNVRRTDKQYDYMLRGRGTTKANISTFYYLAKSNGIDITSERTKTIVRTTKTGKKAGLKPKQIIDNLEKFSDITGADEIVNSIFEAVSTTETESDGVLEQLEMFIQNNYNLQMNEVTGYLEQEGKQLDQSELNSIFIAAKKVIPTIDYNLLMRLLKSEFIHKYNPFFKFFGSDGIPVVLPPIPDPIENYYPSPLIDQLAQTIKNDNPAFTLFFVKKWIVSIVSAAHKVHSPLLLCLLGGQNTGKTEWFRRLLPKELQAYYAESKLDKEKDDELLMTENLIIMDDELGGKSKQDNQKLKNLTSKQYFSLRRPYGDHNEKILRLAVLCGTSNFKEVLSDATGNRRIIPVEVTDIDKHLYNSIDKRELFLEAFQLYKAGFDWRINHGDIIYLNKNQDRYQQTVIERELIGRFYEVVESDEWDRMTTSEIKVEIELHTHQRLSLPVLGRELEFLGFHRKSIRDGETSIKRWLVKKKEVGKFNIS